MPIVLTKRKNHHDFLTDLLRGFTPYLIVLRGGDSAKKRQEILSASLEVAPARTSFSALTHAYAGALSSATPMLSDERPNHIKLEGEVPSPIDLPSGYVFHRSCAHANERCRPEMPRMQMQSDGVQVACHAVEKRQALSALRLAHPTLPAASFRRTKGQLTSSTPAASIIVPPSASRQPKGSPAHNAALIRPTTISERIRMPNIPGGT